MEETKIQRKKMKKEKTEEEKETEQRLREVERQNLARQQAEIKAAVVARNKKQKAPKLDDPTDPDYRAHLELSKTHARLSAYVRYTRSMIGSLTKLSHPTTKAWTSVGSALREIGASLYNLADSKHESLPPTLYEPTDAEQFSFTTDASPLGAFLAKHLVFHNAQLQCLAPGTPAESEKKQFQRTLVEQVKLFALQVESYWQRYDRTKTTAASGAISAGLIKSIDASLLSLQHAARSAFLTE